MGGGDEIHVGDTGGTYLIFHFEFFPLSRFFYRLVKGLDHGDRRQSANVELWAKKIGEALAISITLSDRLWRGSCVLVHV